MRTLPSLAVFVAIPLASLSAQSAGATSPPPIGAYDVVPELPGMGRPVDIAATAARRRALLQRIGRGAALIPAAHERTIEQDYVPLGPATREERRISDLAFSGADVRNLLPIVDSMRVVKDADEIARLRRAVNISVAGHIAAMRVARPGMYEYELEAALEDGFRRNGADRLGYPSIVGSGPNSTTLHYDVNRRRTENGDLVVIDAAAEWGQYTADVTRTFPVNGRFTPLQKAIYDLVLGAQRAAFDSR